MGGAWQDVAGSAVSGREADIVAGWSVSAAFSAVTATAVRVYIKNKADCSSNGSSGFQLYVKGFNVGLTSTAAYLMNTRTFSYVSNAAQSYTIPSGTQYLDLTVIG